MKKFMLLAALAAGLTVAGPGSAGAATTCTFTTKGSTMTLAANCTTDSTIPVPNGMTLDGKGRTITASDPAGGHFTGAVVANGGAVANVKNLTIVGNFTADVCDAGADRLRGIMFDGASGSITKNTVTNVTQPGSGCQEGNSIEVRNFDSPGTKTVDVSKNVITDWMKTGIVANGDVDVDISENTIGASANTAHLAANGIQLGFGASGRIDHNAVAGSQWCGNSDDVATGILLYESGPAVGEHNKVLDEGTDCNVNGYDIGIGNYGDDQPGGDPSTNTVDHNTVSGFDTPFDGPVGSHNKAKPSA